MPWMQLSVVSRLPELAEEILLAQGAVSVSLHDNADDPVFEPWPGQTPLWQQTRAVGMFSEAQDLDAVEAALRETLPEGARLQTARARLDDQEWTRVWLRDWKPLRFGRRLWVAPEAQRAQVTDPQAVIVALDPGLAFGTGTHPTTALCLEWLDGQNVAGKTVLDYGCGSGVLAVAALKLGAARAVGVDIDPQALTALRNNAEANGVGDRVETFLPDDFRETEFDVVLANILSGPLVQLAPRLAACTREGGALALAGLLTRQAPDVRRAYAPWFEFEAGAVREDWERLQARRRCKS